MTAWEGPEEKGCVDWADSDQGLRGLSLKARQKVRESDET
jgi:hypothetical protein